MKFTLEETQALIDISLNYKNKDARWNAFVKHELFKAKGIAKGTFLKKVERIPREYIQYHERFVHDNRLIAAKEIQFFLMKGEFPSEYGGVGKPRGNLLQNFNDRKSTAGKGFTQGGEGDVKSSDSFEEKFDQMMSVIKTIAVLLILVTVVVMFVVPRGEQSSESTVEDQLQSCVDSMRIDAACAADPVFTYCGIAFEQHEILGSGCTSLVEQQGGASAQEHFCKTKLEPIVNKQCAIKVFGCGAVTGSSDC